MSRVLSLLRENWQWKLLSIVAAVMLWLALVDSPELTATVDVPIEFARFPNGLDFADTIPSQVQLQLRGPKSSVVQMQRSSPTVILDLGRIQKPGEYTFRVEDGVSDIPPNVQVVAAVPNQIRLVLERHVQREVPVRLRMDGLKDRPEYRIVRTEVEPASVVISGPETSVGRVEAVSTDLLEFGTIELREEEPVVQARLQAYVDQPRVKIESSPSIRARVWLQRIAD